MILDRVSIVDMNKHLQDARSALNNPNRMGGEPKVGDILASMHQAIEAILKYLEESDNQTEPKRSD